MPRLSSRRIRELRALWRQIVLGPQVLAFFPATVLAAFWIGGEVWLIIVALAIPALYSMTGTFRLAVQPPDLHPRDSTTGLPLRKALEEVMDDRLTTAFTRGRTTACFTLCIDDFGELAERYGRSAAEEVLARTADRIRAAVRGDDMVARLGEDSYGIGLAAVSYLDLEVAIQLAARLQSAVEEPIALGATSIYISCSVGFCLSSRTPERTGLGIIVAAEDALEEARRNAPSAIRSFSAELGKRRPALAMPTSELESALETGHIRPFFQPQISTDTGRVTGFEALARWCHPERGVISPAEFLPVVERMGMMQRLGEKMLESALAALRDWDRAGLSVPQIGVNFAAGELLDPKLMEKVQWQLDRYDLAPERLTVEVLETVVAASPEDVVSRNINGLARMGCRIDLDDFGTGHASISSIRRFAVARIKIDRSFVMKVDRDSEQQKMVSAILTMAERLGLDTLAEGVETRGEHAMLAQLGCQNVQGFGIARPMPMEQTVDWVRAHDATVDEMPRVERRTGP
ncbi:diguanylate cyclase [Oceanicola sp. 22II-s10i]|uniref:putative bifunctional diguanylate cyclase/phosphodiesterase n=1 Tax=Oceanicola sp. 22II-s10i TaxID=1317116 RepID=UPI000B525046|nr:bifunctional diguanylate cyclase/phosphodiesterase [Oceanicola sp. 22II-s10i]OWU83997.1 diguanylate cyclase [Oceanicola sp. 22II-s10i]